MNEQALSLAQELIAADDVGSAISQSEFFNQQAKNLTEALCSSDTFDSIFQFDDGYYLFVSNEVTGEFEPEYLGSERVFTIYVTPDHIGADVTEEFQQEFIEELKNELPGFSILEEDGVTDSGLEKWFSNELERAWEKALNNVSVS